MPDNIADIAKDFEKAEYVIVPYEDFVWRLGKIDEIEIRGMHFLIDHETEMAITPNGKRIDFSDLYAIETGIISNYSDLRSNHKY